MSSDKIKVAVRVRPPIEREASLNSQWVIQNNNIYQVDDNGSRVSEPYSFDHIFDCSKNNVDVYQTVVHELVNSSLDGFNSTIFAYGQTSSGKTFTMMGSEEGPGITQLALDNMFHLIHKRTERRFLLRVSYVEIYNEQINDLLDSKNTDVKIREDFYSNNFIISKEEIISNIEQVLRIMKQGDKVRKIGCTNMNERSSRSHSIFRIIIESTSTEATEGPIQISNFNLVDLAGSERVSQTGAAGVRLKEGVHINKSLSTLSLVIRQLSEGEKYINFRDSKLTRLLQHALGGNAKTLVIATITTMSVEETNSTLSFAKRAKSVKNQPHVNEIIDDKNLAKRYQALMSDYKSRLESELIKNKALQAEKETSSLLISQLADQLKAIEKFQNIKPEDKAETSGRRRRHTIGEYTPSFSRRLVHQQVAPKTSLAEEALSQLPIIQEEDSNLLDNITPVDLTEDLSPEMTRRESGSTFSNRPIATPPALLRARCAALEDDYKELVEFTRNEKELPEEESTYKERYEKASKDYLDMLTLYNDIKKKQDALTKDHNEIKQENKNLKDELQELAERFETATQKNTELQETIDQSKKEKESLIEQMNTDNEVLIEEIKKRFKEKENYLQIKINEMQKIVPKSKLFHTPESKRNGHAENKVEIEELEDKIASLTLDNTNANAKIESLTARIRHLEQELKSGQKLLFDSDEKLFECLEEQKILSDERDRLTKELAECKTKLNEEMPSLENELKMYKEVIEELGKEKVEIVSEIESKLLLLKDILINEVNPIHSEGPGEQELKNLNERQNVEQIVRLNLEVNKLQTLLKNVEAERDNSTSQLEITKKELEVRDIELAEKVAEIQELKTIQIIQTGEEINNMKKQMFETEAKLELTKQEKLQSESKLQKIIDDQLLELQELKSQKICLETLVENYSVNIESLNRDSKTLLEEIGKIKEEKIRTHGELTKENQRLTKVVEQNIEEIQKLEIMLQNVELENLSKHLKEVEELKTLQKVNKELLDKKDKAETQNNEQIYLLNVRINELEYLLSSVEIEHENCGLQLETVNDKCEDIGNNLAQRILEIEELKSVLKDKTELQRKYDECNSALQWTKAELDRLQTEQIETIEELRNINEQKSHFEKQCYDCNFKLQLVTQQKNEAELTVKLTTAEIEQLNREIVDEKIRRQELESLLENVTQENKKLTNNLKEINVQCVQLLNEKNLIELQHNQCEKLVMENQKVINELENLNSEYKKVIEDLADVKIKNEELAEENQNIQEQLDREIEQRRSGIAKLDHHISKHKGLENELKNYTSKLEIAEQGFRNLEDKFIKQATEIEELTVKLTAAEEQSQKDIAELKVRKQELECLLENLNSENKKLTEDLTDAKVQCDQLLNEKIQIELEHKRCEKFVSENHRLCRKLADVKRKNKELDEGKKGSAIEIVRLNLENTKFITMYQALEAEHKNCSSKLEVAEQKYKALEDQFSKEISEVNEMRIGLENLLRTSEKKLEEMSSEKVAMENKLLTLQKEVEELKKPIITSSDTESLSAKLYQKTLECDELIKKNEKLKNRYLEANQDRNEFREGHKRSIKLLALNHELNKKCTLLEQTTQDQISAINKLKQENEMLLETINTDKREYDNLSAGNKKLLQELEQCAEEYNLLLEKNKSMEKLQKEKEDLEKKLNQSAVAIEMLKYKIKQHEKQLNKFLEKEHEAETSSLKNTNNLEITKLKDKCQHLEQTRDEQSNEILRLIDKINELECSSHREDYENMVHNNKELTQKLDQITSECKQLIEQKNLVEEMHKNCSKWQEEKEQLLGELKCLKSTNHQLNVQLQKTSHVVLREEELNKQLQESEKKLSECDKIISSLRCYVGNSSEPSSSIPTTSVMLSPQEVRRARRYDLHDRRRSIGQECYEGGDCLRCLDLASQSEAIKDSLCRAIKAFDELKIKPVERSFPEVSDSNVRATKSAELIGQNSNNGCENCSQYIRLYKSNEFKAMDQQMKVYKLESELKLTVENYEAQIKHLQGTVDSQKAKLNNVKTTEHKEIQCEIPPGYNELFEKYQALKIVCVMRRNENLDLREKLGLPPPASR